MIYRKEVTESTNLDARSGIHGDVFVAEFQTAGRGRLDHTWLSRKGEGLMFSMVLSAEGREPAEVATLPLVAGLAVRSALSALPHTGDFRLKWPNDILCAGRKVCGILCERVGDNVIAGIGINVNETDFPPEISGRATSMRIVVGTEVDRERLLADVIDALFAYHRRWVQGGFAALHAEYAENDFLKGRRVKVTSTDDDADAVDGMCEGVQGDGTLSVAGRSVWAGEAHVDSF